jgi:transcription antitermination factor NusG
MITFLGVTAIRSAFPAVDPDDPGCRRRPRWFVARAVPRLDRLATNLLDACGVERREFLYLAPLPRTRKLVERPWLPGYHFVSLDIALDPWEALSALPGLRGFLSDEDGFPVPLRDGEIERLGETLPLRPAAVPGDPPVRIPDPGDEVRVTKGPLSGLRARCVAADGKVVSLRFDGGFFDNTEMSVNSVEIVRCRRRAS